MPGLMEHWLERRTNLSRSFAAGCWRRWRRRARARARRVLIVSSGGPISTVLADVLGMPLRGVVDLNLQTRNTGITELQSGASRIHCVSFNNVPHLDRPDRAGALTYS